MTIVGVDLGGTKVVATRVDGSGNIGAVAERGTGPDLGGEGLGDLLVDVIQEACGHEALSAIGIGAPGLVDFDSGVLVQSSNLGLQDYPLRETLERRLSVPVVVDNDLNTIALGESRFGAARGAREVVALFIGTGIGAGFVTGGHVVRGRDGAAGEIGHQIFRVGGRSCTCGNSGCYEAYLAGWAFHRDVQEIQGPRTPSWTSMDLRALADKSESTRWIVEKAELAMELMTANIVSLLNPEVLVLGGSVLLGDRHLREAARRGIARFSTVLTRSVDVRESTLGATAGLLGAAALAAERLEGQASIPT